MTPIYFPKTAGLIPRYITQPSSNDSGSKAMLAGLTALTDVANNYRQFKNDQKQGLAVADALEAEGLTEEANLYRSGVNNASVNFFSDPETNQRMNRQYLTDSLNLLKAKQERDLKEKENESMLAYRQAQLEEMKANRDARIEASKDAREARADNNKALQEDRNSKNLLNSAKVLDDQANDYEKQADSILEQAKTSDIPEDQVPQIANRVNGLRQTASELRAKSRSRVMESTGEKDFNVSSPVNTVDQKSIQTGTRRRIAQEQYVKEKKREVESSLRPGQSITNFSITPSGNVSYAIKGINGKTVIIERDSSGKVIKQIEESGPIDRANPTGTPNALDPEFQKALNNPLELY